MNDYEKSVERLSKIIALEKERDKKFYSKHVLVYYSPFEQNQSDNYSIHALHILEDSESLEEGVIGNLIVPSEPYYFVENDVLIEFSDNKINVYTAEIHNGTIKLIQKVTKSEDNQFFAVYIKSVFHL